MGNMEATLTPDEAGLWCGGDYGAGQPGAAEKASLVGQLWGTWPKMGRIVVVLATHGKPNVPLRTVLFQCKGFEPPAWPYC